MLNFGKANAKHRKLTENTMGAIASIFNSVFKGTIPTIKNFYTFSLPAGFSCPGALDCLAYANRDTGKMTDGLDQKYRCYAASMECTYPTVRASRWANFDALRGLTSAAMAELIGLSIPKGADIVRVHVSGDFFSPEYFNAWVEVAKNFPRTLFYAYTKSLRHIHTDVPVNLNLTISKGGKFDNLIKNFDLLTANVVFSDDDPEVADVIDHDDSHAMIGGSDFSLVLHGTQPKNTPAGEALKVLRRG